MLTLVAPSMSAAQTTDTTSTAQPFQARGDGIFNCNQTGSYSMSVGALSAVGGVYVPVNDAAVTLNTGYLVYKECILRNVVNRQRESVMASLQKKAVQSSQTSREGKEQYVVDPITEIREKEAEMLLAVEKSMQARKVNPEVIRAVKAAYVNENYNERKNDCPYKENDTYFVNVLLQKVGDSRCNPIGQFYNEQTEFDRVRATAINCLEKEWEWGRGWYAVTEKNPNTTCEKILTPSVVVQESFQTVFDSPVRQAESANDIGQIISPLYTSITTQAIGDLKGLTGLLQPQGGQPSYLDRMTEEASAGVRTAALNAAIQILNAARSVEASYLAAKTTLANKMTATINGLRTAEKQCWELIIPKVCTSTLSAEKTCLDSSGSTLQVATTTTASQAIITAQIAPVAVQVAADVTLSQSAVQLIQQLILGVTNTTSITAQRIALEQLDTLVAQKKLHNQNDLTQAQKQRDDALTILEQLLQDTVKLWADSPDSNVGWCNINNQAVIEMWKTRWKK